jgi:hypothetical protein
MATTNEKVLVGALIATIIIAGIIIGLTRTQTIHNIGTINSLGFFVWADQNRTTLLSSIDWGSLNPGDLKGVTGWAQITGTVNVSLSFITWNWNPTTAQQYLVFGWNLTGQIYQPGQVFPLQLTLQAFSNATGITSFTSFSFDINMTATQV